MPLTDTDCRHAKRRESPYKMADGEGMYLFVQPNGSKLWRMAYRYGGKQKTLAFGAYPYVGLADARRKRTEAKTALAAGKDPGVKASPVETLDALARRWFAIEKVHWAESNSGRVWSRIERDALPELGHKLVSAIEPMDVLTALRKVEDRGAIEVAKRLKQSLASMFRLAIAEGVIKYNPCADIGDGLKPSPRVRHMAMVKPEGIHDLVAAIKGYQGERITTLALLLTLHTFARTGEVRFAQWSEIDGDTWRIPPERMKMGREHLVPLTADTKELLQEAAQYREGPYIFPGGRGKAMSENTMIYGLYRLGFRSRQTVHGFRRLASTVLNESNLFHPDHIERQLAHVPGDQIRGIYNAAQWLPARRKMMAWWSDFVEARVKLPEL
jgi:integrase